MSVTLTTLDEKPAVEIEGADGKVKLYGFRVEQQADGWTCSLTQKDGKAYRVRCGKRGLWSCDCPAWSYSADRWESGCKHTQASIELKKILEVMSQ